MDTTLADPLVGRLLDGRYQVEALVALGGMATVYRAIDTRLDRRVALKVMHADLARAHTAGIVHRDVKPENVLIAPDGHLKVVDFGLARALSVSSQTRKGMIIGIVAYLAPEQVTGTSADARTDVYAAGIVLFELLTGAKPHTGHGPLAVAYKHVNETVPAPSRFVQGIPPEVDRLVLQATSRDPRGRPADAADFLRLRGYVETVDVPAP